MAAHKTLAPAQPHAAAPGAMAETIIQPVRGWPALRLREVWDQRELLWVMTYRNLQTRYRQMALGPLWIVIQPLMNMVLYTILFGGIAKLPSDGQPYAIFTYVALLPWSFFSDSIGAASSTLAENKGLISKIYFPRLIPTLARMLSSLVDFAISFVILIVLLIVSGSRPNAGVLLLPVFLAIAGLCGLAVGLWFSGIVVRFRDFGQVVGYLVRFWMYATPVVYSIKLVPEAWLPLYRLNPMTGVIEGFRWALLGSGHPPDWTMLVSTLLLVPVLIGGLYVFRRVERNIVDIA